MQLVAGDVSDTMLSGVLFAHNSKETFAQKTKPLKNHA
jgi:hypothetical protein